MAKEKKPVYNGYEEAYVTGKELKEIFKDSFYTGGRHHTTVYALPIPILLELVGVHNDTTYRIFINQFFCRVMKSDTDGLVFFFGHTTMDNVVECRHDNYPVSTICPNCGKQLKLKKGKYGEFIGCSGYPECMHKLNIQYLGTIY